MSDRIKIISGLGDFNTSPSGVLRVVDGKITLDKVKAFNRARRYTNAGVNTWRILRRGIWSIDKPFDFEDEGYWTLFKEYVEILHQPFQGTRGFPPGADVWIEIFDGCSEDWMYDPANYERARKLMRGMFNALGGLPYVKFGVGNEVSSPYARAFVRDCVYPEFKLASRKPFAYGASYVRQNPPGSKGPLEWQAYESENAFDYETMLTIYRPVHSVKDSSSMNLIDTVKYWVEQGNPLCVIWSVDGIWDGQNLCDRVIYNGVTQVRPSPWQIQSAMNYWMNATNKFRLPNGQVKYGYEYIGKQPNADDCQVMGYLAICDSYNAKFGVRPENYLRYPEDWVVPPEPPTPPTPPVPTDCKCRYWLKGWDLRRWWDCVFGDGPKKCR